MDDVAVGALSAAVSGRGTVVENAANATEISDSISCDQTFMEESKRPTNEANSKNSSLEEDLLGANSLLMSDTDDDEIRGGLKPVPNALSQKPIIPMSTNEVSCEQINEMYNKTETVAQNFLQTNTPEKLSLMEGSQLPKVSINSIEYSNNITINDHTQDKDNVQKKKNKRFSAILDSDSDESEINGAPKQATNVRSKFSTLIDSESDSESEEKEMEELKRNKYKFIDSDSDHKEKFSVEKYTKTASKQSLLIKPGLIDSDSSSNTDSELSGDEENSNIGQEDQDNLQQMELNIEEQTSGLQKKPMRASAKKALDEMQAIQSEQQRLHREAHINVPYHRPKRYTLQEFLNRRSITKTAAEGEYSPVATLSKIKSLKMTPEELEEYTKLMEERAKEATEFFKSESESEEEELKDNVAAMDVDEKQQVVENSESNDHNEEFPLEHQEKILNTAQLDSPIAHFIDNEIVGNSEIELTIPHQMNSQPLVIEVLELPNLDLSTLHVDVKDDITPDLMHITAPANTSTSAHQDIEVLKKQLINDQKLFERPTIKGDANMVIDLESGDMSEKKPTGADHLLQRLLATHRARKTKTSETTNIQTNENAKLELTKANIHINDNEDVNKDHKPGAAYVKLKENLKTLIRKKRVEAMQKKQEDEREYNKCLEGDDDYDDDQDEEDIEEYEIEEKGENVKKQKYRPDKIIIDEEENVLNVSDVDDDVEELGAEEEEEASEVELEAEKDEEDETKKIEAEVEETTYPTEFDTKSNLSNDTDKDSSDSDEENDELDSNAEFKLPVTATQRKNRIIKAFAADSDADEDDMELLKTQIPIVQSNIENPIFGGMESPLKSCISIPCSDIGAGNTQELLDLCSGSFDATQNHSNTAAADTVIISQIPMTQRTHLNDASEELLGLCSGAFEVNNEEQQQIQTTQITSIDIPDAAHEAKGERVETITYRILSSDEEVSGTPNTNADTRKRIKKLRKKLKKRQIKLGFSDDEDDNVVADQSSNASENVEVAQLVDSNDEETEMPQTYIEYDSEENEIVVEMTKKDRIKRAEGFFENEAELSESDWGSADEDEKHMDHYDIELCDEDEFDRDKLQQELGQIHARKMLDDDIRKMRKIQEMLFEDEETDGVGRQRQFRWKNAENGFSLDDMRAGGAGEGNIDGEDVDEEQEHLWRKIRFEREQLLKEQGLKENSQEIVSTTSDFNSPLTTIIANNSKNISKNITPILVSNGKKLELIKMNATSTITAKKNLKSSSFLISPNTFSTGKITIVGTTPPTTSILQPKIARGSFLTRDKDTLAKFAILTKSKIVSGFGDDEAAGNVSAKGKNFVFTTLTKEEHEHLKRKAEDHINSSNETGTNFIKKPRVNGDKQCLIDQLLM